MPFAANTERELAQAKSTFISAAALTVSSSGTGLSPGACAPPSGSGLSATEAHTFSTEAIGATPEGPTTDALSSATRAGRPASEAGHASTEFPSSSTGAQGPSSGTQASSDALNQAGREPPLLGGALLRRLNQRRDGPGWIQLTSHLLVVVVGGTLWAWPPLTGAGLPLGLAWGVKLLGLMLLGWGLAFAFCAMHECGHRTAFSGRRINDTVAWWAGVLSFYNADFYRRYHQWHHRYTHLPGLDPELEDSPPSTRWDYVFEVSGVPWWLGKLRSHWRGLRGDFSGSPYIPADAALAVQRSLQRQFAVYALLLLLGLGLGHDVMLRFWLLPLALGQPLLRFVLLAEHGGCPCVADGQRNTRTTLTLAPLRRLMWNMPFHAEHHLLPSVPFHALAEAHQHLAPRLVFLQHGYGALHASFLRQPQQLAIQGEPGVVSPL